MRKTGQKMKVMTKKKRRGKVSPRTKMKEKTIEEE